MEILARPSRRRALQVFGAGIVAPNILIPRAVHAEGPTVLRSIRVPPPKVTGEAVIVIDPNTVKVLYTRNADEHRAVASTQKLLTALITVEGRDLDGMVTVAETDTQVEPTKLYIKAGQRYRRRDLVEALLVKSGNDVARCLARDYAGSQKAFARVMNARAKRLGMRNSHFVTSNGLTAPGQHSTARDMGILALASYRNPVIRSFTKKKTIDFRYADGREVTFSNTNKLLKRSSLCNGMKTGYTSASGKCLVSSGASGQRDCLAVILGSRSKYIFDDSLELLEWGMGIS